MIQRFKTGTSQIQARHLVFHPLNINITALQRPTAVGKDEMVVNFMLTYCQKFQIKNLIIIMKQE